MKFNWGTGIVIGMVVYMGFIITLSTKMIGTKVDLVDKNYYELGIEHEQHIAQIKAAQALSQPVEVNLNFGKQQLELKFPNEFNNQKIKGTITLFRPADKNKDIKQAIKLDEQLSQSVSILDLSEGIWKVKLQWSSNGKSYYQEKDIVL
jgi:nitrogen fixation protein FixH